MLVDYGKKQYVIHKITMNINDIIIKNKMFNNYI